MYAEVMEGKHDGAIRGNVGDAALLELKLAIQARLKV
jgi:hypothetical protein